MLFTPVAGYDDYSDSGRHINLARKQKQEGCLTEYIYDFQVIRSSLLSVILTGESIYFKHSFLISMSMSELTQ